MLYHTGNGGETWVPEYEGNQPIYGLTFTEGGDGYAVGAEGLIVRRIVFTNTDNPQVQAVRLFPNPAADQVRVANWDETGTARLLDLQGRLLRQFVLQAQEPISLAGLVPGMYVLDLQTARAHYQARVVKQ